MDINKITVIVPVYNEAKTIGQVIKKLDELYFDNINKEIIIVDDGSTDGTKEILESLRAEGLDFKVIFHEKNAGKGAALRSGLAASSGDIIAIQDADLEYNPDELKKLLTPLIQKESFVVYGSRFKMENPILYKRYYVGNRILSWLVSVLYGQKITDSYTCYKLFFKKTLNDIDLKSDGFDIEAEITCKLIKKGYKILELPITYRPRSLGEGKKISWSDALKGLWTILRNRL